MDCDAAYVCLERVLVHFGTSHVVLMMLGEFIQASLDHIIWR